MSSYKYISASWEGIVPRIQSLGSRPNFSGHGQDTKFSFWVSWAALCPLALIIGSKAELGQTQHHGTNRWDRHNKYSKLFSFLHVLWESILICVVAVQWGSSAYWPECLQMFLATPPMPELNYDGKPSPLYKASLPLSHMSSLFHTWKGFTHLNSDGLWKQITQNGKVHLRIAKRLLVSQLLLII